jgi:hypothetical protein
MEGHYRFSAVENPDWSAQYRGIWELAHRFGAAFLHVVHSAGVPLGVALVQT